MPIRAVIVLLLVLNLGVAAWWLSRPAAPDAPQVPPQPAGVPRLQLFEEKVGASTAAATAGTGTASLPVPTAVAVPSGPAAATPSPLPVAVSSLCFSLGPFADAAAASVAASRMVGQSVRRRPRETPGKGASGYNVFLPPSNDRDTAQALAGRIGAAGFDDYLLINSGALLNGIALGRYRSREAAERRQASLAAAGFAAQLQPIGQEGATQWWLDVEAAGNTSGTQLKALANAAQSRSLDCATLR